MKKVAVVFLTIISMNTSYPMVTRFGSRMPKSSCTNPRPIISNSRLPLSTVTQNRSFSNRPVPDCKLPLASMRSVTPQSRLLLTTITQKRPNSYRSELSIKSFDDLIKTAKFYQGFNPSEAKACLLSVAGGVGICALTFGLGWNIVEMMPDVGAIETVGILSTIVGSPVIGFGSGMLIYEATSPQKRQNLVDALNNKAVKNFERIFPALELLKCLSEAKLNHKELEKVIEGLPILPLYENKDDLDNKLAIIKSALQTVKKLSKDPHLLEKCKNKITEIDTYEKHLSTQKELNEGFWNNEKVRRQLARELHERNERCK